MLLEDKSKNVKKEAAKALGKIRDPSSVEALIAALARDANPYIGLDMGEKLEL